MAYIGPAPANSIIATSDIEDGAVTSAKLGGNIVTPGTLDVNGQELILDANANTSLTADTDDQVDIKVGGTDVVTLTDSSLVLKGTTPTLTIGDAGTEDTKIVFDGNAQDFHIGLDDTADSLAIGLGSALGTTDHMVFDATGAVTKPLQPGFYAWSSGATTIATDATTEITWTSERFDTNADFDLAGERFTAPVAGVYLMNVTISAVYGMGTTDGGRVSLYFYKNGALYEEFKRIQCASGVDFAEVFGQVGMSGSIIEDAAADDYYEVFFYNATGATVSINYTQGYSSFSGVLLG